MWRFDGYILACMKIEATAEMELTMRVRAVHHHIGSKTITVDKECLGYESRELKCGGSKDIHAY